MKHKCRVTKSRKHKRLWVIFCSACNGETFSGQWTWAIHTAINHYVNFKEDTVYDS
jgi:hypothetical protein